MSEGISARPPRPRKTGGEGGLGARLEATLKERAPQPKGKGLVMLIIAAAVIVAVIIDMRRRADEREVIRAERAAAEAAAAAAGADTTGAGTGAPDGGAPAATHTPGARPDAGPEDGVVLDARLGALPGHPPADLANSADWALRLIDWRRASTPGSARRLREALLAAPAAERDAARAYLAERLEATLAAATPAERGASLGLAADLLAWPGSEPLAAGLRRRLANQADNLLDDAQAAEGAVLLLGALPPDERRSERLVDVATDGRRPLAERVLAAVALPRPLPPAAAALAAAPDTPDWLRAALR